MSLPQYLAVIVLLAVVIALLSENSSRRFRTKNQKPKALRFRPRRP